MQKMSLQAAYETDIHHFSLLCLPLRKPRPLLCGFILIAKELTAEGMPEDSTEGRREIRSETRLQSPHFPQPSIKKPPLAFVCDQGERAFITPSRVARRALPAQKIRARGVKQ